MKPTGLFILNQPEKYRDMMLHVVAVIEHALPEASLEFKWKVPYFYYKKKPLCYLNSNHKRQYLDIGFAKGFQLKHNLEHLNSDDGRNTVKSLRYSSLEEIDNAILIALLQEAITLY